ncbi:hypothetical protein AOQ84DRAFT_366620 [Glonium stellatum]|uniref:DUF7730 domain-containing protein n=1 Tax=Glonium stellatum TaxID=574774 RepID=A0A8E2JQL8_9PEZI|nr:hypothetical protein AOQ84DRAFT_366620 [Glonium stellatum]
MADTQVVVSPYPKRKRPQVSYYEGEEGDFFDSDYSDTEPCPAKKSKATPKSSRPLPKRKIFPFLSLPAELRNAIYALALTDKDGIYLVSKTKDYRRIVELAPVDPVFRTVHSRARFGRIRGGYLDLSDSKEPEPPKAIPCLATALLATNRQIYSEAQPVLYSNTFMLEDTTALHAFMASLSPKTRGLLETISIHGWGYTKAHKALNHPGLTMLADAVNLRQLHFDTRIAYGGDPKRVARQIYRDGFHWLEAVGLAKGRKDAAVELIEVAETNWDRSRRRLEGPAQHNQEAFRDELRKRLMGVPEKHSRKKSKKIPG